MRGVRSPLSKVSANWSRILREIKFTRPINPGKEDQAGSKLLGGHLSSWGSIDKQSSLRLEREWRLTTSEEAAMAHVTNCRVVGTLGTLTVPYLSLYDYVVPKWATGRVRDVDDSNRLWEALDGDLPGDE